MLNVRQFFQSFRDAARGISYVFKTEQNFRVQIIAGLGALTLAWFFRLPRWQIIFVILLIGAVLAMELLNTVVEHMVDLVKPRLHHYVMVIKDIAAAAALITSIGALLIGIIIFAPYFINLLK